MTDMPISFELSPSRIGRMGGIWRNLVAYRKKCAELQKRNQALAELNADQLRDIGLNRCEMLCEMHSNASKDLPL